MRPTSSSYPVAGCRLSGFTLVELLTVIAIIGVLAAIIIPVTGKARASARSSTCVSNLRQLGVAMRLFAADNGNRLPFSYDVGNSGAMNSWWYVVNPYTGAESMKPTWESVRSISQRGVYRCPETDPTDTSYPMNPWVSYKMSQRFRQVNSGDAPGVRVGLHLNQVPSPSSTLLLAEGRVTPEFNKCNPAIDSAYSVVYPHHDKLNALFVDGHVASFTYPELNAQWNQLYRF